MPLYLTENFFKLKEKIVQELSGEDQAVYGEPPVYYSRGNEESFHKAKKQLIFLLGKITAENESALVQLNVLKENVDKLTINCEDVEKEPLLIDLKKRFESLYCYNQHLLKHLRAEQFSDLTLGRCYQGAYSNAVMLIDRIIAGDGLTNYLLSAKRELIQQQAFNFMLETGAAFPNIHSVNGFYNHVAASYNMQPITDAASHGVLSTG